MALSLSIDSPVFPDTDAVFRELDGEGVVLNLSTGQYYGLNEVGTRAWQLIREHRNLRGVFDGLRREFDVEDDRLQRDLLTLVAQLRDKGLVRVGTLGA